MSKNISNNIWPGSSFFLWNVPSHLISLYICVMLHKLQSPLMCFSNAEEFSEGEKAGNAIPILQIRKLNHSRLRKRYRQNHSPLQT